MDVLVPRPYLTEDEAHCPSHCEGVGIEVLLVANQPVAVSPEGHPVGHGRSAVGYSSTHALRAIEHPLGKTEGHFGELRSHIAPVEGEGLLCGGWGESLE